LAKQHLARASELDADHPIVDAYLAVVQQMTQLKPQPTVDTATTEAVEQEEAKQTQAKQEQATQEQATQERAKQERAKQEQAKQEQAKQEQAKQEQAKQATPEAAEETAQQAAERQRAAAAFAFLANKNKPKASDDSDPTTKTTPLPIDAVSGEEDAEDTAAAEIQAELEELNQDVRSTIETPQQPDAPLPTVCKGTVLVVDDSPTVRKLVSMTLRSEGYEMQTAEDGIEAMKVLVESTPDLILLDINMPRMDGYKLCKLIKGHPDTSSIPVVMLSGKDGMFDKLRGKLVGCNDYISKPFETADLLKSVAQHIERVALAK
jgi:twitching motility two-component system response regulator PilG